MDLERLADLLAAPDDDAPRLAFAEHVRAEDPARARYIELSCELERDGRENATLTQLAEERALLRDGSRRWAGPVVRRVKGYELRRGFVERISLTATQLSEHERTLFFSAPIREVTVYGDGAEAIFRSPFLHRLHTVRIGSCRPQPGQLRRLLGRFEMRSIRELDLCGVSASFQDFRDALFGHSLTRVEALRLAGTPLLRRGMHTPTRTYGGGADGIRVLTENPRLRGLRRLSLTDVEDADARAIAEAPMSAGIEELSVHGPRLTDAGVRALAELPALEVLEIQNAASPKPRPESPFRARLIVRPDEADLRGIASHEVVAWLADPRRQRVVDLEVAGVAFDDAAAAALVSSGMLSRLARLRVPKSPTLTRDAAAHMLRALGEELEDLELHWLEIGDVGARAIAETDLPALRRLVLTHSGIGPEGAAAIAEWSSLGHVERLWLTENPIRDAGAEALAACPHLGRIRSLSIEGCDVSTVGASAIVRAPALREIRWLSMRNNPRVGAAAASALLEAPWLRQLERLDMLGTALRRQEEIFADWTGYEHGRADANPEALELLDALGDRFSCG